MIAPDVNGRKGFVRGKSVSHSPPPDGRSRGGPGGYPPSGGRKPLGGDWDLRDSQLR
jgi:hypothetical protein